MPAVAVAGVGMAPFGRHRDRSATSLATEAVDNALRDAGLEWRDVQTMYCGVLLMGLTPGTRFGAELGLTGIPIVNIDNASASGSSAFREACLAVRSGRVDVALDLDRVFAGGVNQLQDALVAVFPVKHNVIR